MSILKSLQQLKKAGMILLIDDEDRENEGDLIVAAELVTAEQINSMTKHARGLICVALSKELCNRLGLKPLKEGTEAEALHGTSFCMSVDAIEGCTSGISAQDRAVTARLLADAKSTRSQFAFPGHLFPLQEAEGGIFARRGHTEASVELCRMAGLSPAAVICEVLAEDGSMARGEQLFILAEQLGIPVLTVEEVVSYKREQLLSLSDEVVEMPTDYGDFKMSILPFEAEKEHLCLWKGNPFNDEKPIVRIHSECVTGDLFGSMRCDCGHQLRNSMKMISSKGSGMIIYLRQEGRGIGLKSKLQAYVLQQKGLDTIQANQALGYEADLRDYGVAAQFLKLHNIHEIELLTNNPDKVEQLRNSGVRVSRIPLLVDSNKYNQKYFKTKETGFGHLFNTGEQNGTIISV
jgi:3,4-dihydroxy 2-butanone 4-phosphate synthase/GTP cyclohydrolase II